MSEFKWIPLVWIESKGLEEDGFPEGVMMIWSDMPMPGDEILISSNGFVDAGVTWIAGSIGRTSMHGCQCRNRTEQTKRSTIAERWITNWR